MHGIARRTSLGFALTLATLLAMASGAQAGDTQQVAAVELAQVQSAQVQSAQGQFAQGSAIREIVIEGTQRVEPGTVRSYMLIQEGDLFDAQRLDRSLKSLFATGLFDDVSFRQDGDRLVVTVKENPIINRIAFEGNGELEGETLESEVSLRPRVIYTRTKVQNDVKRLLTLYRQSGLFAATIEPKIIKLEQNRIDLVFEISEGEETQINSIRFVGNGEFSDRRLREVVRTRETVWWRLFSSDDVYDPDRLNLDRELLRRFYISNGYADFRVLSAVAELTADRRDFFLTFTIEEGARYAFGDVAIDVRLKGLKVEDIDDGFEIDSGDWYDAEAVEKTIEKLTNAVGEKGIAFVEVRPRINRNRDKRTIDVKFEVVEGPRVFVERIDIVGNVRTRDEVIRREFRLVEGDAFNSAKIRRSRQRIQNLDFFEKVDFEQLPGSAEDRTVVKIDVEEKSTGQISIGAGFSSSAGVLGDFSIRESNFLGRGQDVSLRLLIAAERSAINLGFTEPYFLRRDVRAGFDIFRSTQDLQDTSSLDLEQTGFDLRSNYLITEDLSQGWRYEFSVNKVDDVGTDASELIKAQSGTDTISEISHTIHYDKRNTRINTSEGYNLRLTTDIAGLGGSTRHLRNKVEATYYIPVVDQWVISIGGTAGYILGLGKNVRFQERFFVGGDDLRGFETAGLGPRDRLTKDSLGGEWKATGRIQLQFPLVGLPEELGLQARVFTDFGTTGQIEPTNDNVQDDASLRASIGSGLTWLSPFGPMGLDFAFAVLKEDFDQEELVRVNFGTTF